MRVLDLFSGIGGFSLGLERAGMQTVAFCEIEEFCRKVLKKHWPDVPIFEDVRKLRGDDLGTIDLICGGYPCQPFSLAGERRGQDDDRHLWPEMFRLLQETNARWLIGENVNGHISMGLDQVLSDLESENYEAQPIVIPACAIDAPHQRDRVWIIAHARGEQYESDCHAKQWQRTKELLEAFVADSHREWELQQEGHEQEQRRRIGNSGETLANANAARLQEREVFAGGESEARSTQPGQTFKRNRRWPTEPDVGRVANGVPRRVDRLRALGNAVVPQIPEMIGRAIMAIDGLENTGDSRCSGNAARFK